MITHQTSGEPDSWGGEYGQMPVYSSGTSTGFARVVPLREEITVNDQSYGLGDLHCWFPYDTTVGFYDEILFSGTSFDGTYVVNDILKNDINFETYLKQQRTR